MRKDYCDKCGVELTKKIVWLQAYTEGESINHDGYGSTNHFLSLELCDACSEVVKTIILDSLKINNIMV